jgi:phage repressor protein C with HTH and peptisase S24 domain
MATATLADKAGLSLNWVVTGSGEKRLNNEPDQDSELTLLQTERPGFEIALGSSLLTEDQLKKRSVKALISDHDHMSPTIKNGDIVILDKSVTDFTAGVFFVRVSNQDLLCRTSITPFKTIFSFDNSSYIGFEVTKEELKEVTCLGRVIWVCSKL